MGVQISSQNISESQLTGANGYSALYRFAKRIGAVAGYFHGRSAKEMIADAERQMVESPEGFLIAAAVIGLAAGSLLRYRR